MDLMAFFRSDGTLSMREQTLITLAVYAAIKDEQGLAKVRATAKECKIPEALLEQVEAAVQAVCAEAKEGISLDEALATTHSCCGS